MDAAAVVDLLRPHALPGRAEREKAYLKSELAFLGVPAPAIRQVARGLRVEPLAFADDVWDRGLHELRALAVVLLEKGASKLGPDALPTLERLLRTSRTWAYVDALAVHVVGDIAARHDVGATLDRQAVDGDFWIRRSALLALLRPLRRGGGDWDRFVRYAVPMLPEKEFFIRKAIGWVLRETGKSQPDRVRAFVAEHRQAMSGLTLREATRRLPVG